MHSSNVRWADVETRLSTATGNLLITLTQAEELYLELLEVYNYAGSSDQLMADLLFKEVWEGRGDTQASADEVSKVTDVRNAILALHDLYLALDNNALTAEDRATALRRMS